MVLQRSTDETYMLVLSNRTLLPPSTFGLGALGSMTRIVAKSLFLFVVVIILLPWGSAANSTPIAEAEGMADEGAYYPISYGHAFEIPYRIVNGSLEEIRFDIVSERFEIFLANGSGATGVIEVTIPRNLFWSDLLNEFNFTITAEGTRPSEEADHTYLEKTPCESTVSIQFPPSTEKILITRPSYWPTSLRNIGSDGFIATDKACYRQGEPVTVFGFSSFPIDDLIMQSEYLGEEYPPDINFTQYDNGSFISTFVIEGSSAYTGIYAAAASYKKDVNATFPLGVSDARFVLVERNYEGLTAGHTSLVDYKGEKVANAEVTNFYTIATEFDNASNEPKSIRYFVMITDENDVAQRIYAGTPIVPPKLNWMVGQGYLGWLPQTTGMYNIRASVWSSEYLPLEFISSVQPASIEVKEKILRLGEGERDRDLVVRDIDFLNGTVTVSYTICSKTGGQEERTIHAGERVLIADYARAILEGFENGKAIFRFEAAGGGCPGVY